MSLDDVSARVAPHDASRRPSVSCWWRQSWQSRGRDGSWRDAQTAVVIASAMNLASATCSGQPGCRWTAVASVIHLARGVFEGLVGVTKRKRVAADDCWTVTERFALSSSTRWVREWPW